MDLHIGQILKIYKPRKLTKQDIRTWQYKFFNELSESWDSYHKDPLTVDIVRGLLKRFNPDILPTVFEECEKSNSFSKTFWWKWGKLPPVKREKTPKQRKLI